MMKYKIISVSSYDKEEFKVILSSFIHRAISEREQFLYPAEGQEFSVSEGIGNASINSLRIYLNKKFMAMPPYERVRVFASALGIEKEMGEPIEANDRELFSMLVNYNGFEWDRITTRTYHILVRNAYHCELSKTNFPINGPIQNENLVRELSSRGMEYQILADRDEFVVFDDSNFEELVFYDNRGNEKQVFAIGDVIRGAISDISQPIELEFIQFTPDGSHVLFTLKNKGLSDMLIQVNLQNMSVYRFPFDQAKYDYPNMSHDGQSVFMVQKDSNSSVLFKPAQNRQFNLPVKVDFDQVAFAEDGKFIVLIRDNVYYQVFSTDDGKLLVNDVELGRVYFYETRDNFFDDNFFIIKNYFSKLILENNAGVNSLAETQKAYIDRFFYLLWRPNNNVIFIL